MVIYELTAAVREKIAPDDNARFEAELIVMHAAGMTRTKYTLNLRETADEETVRRAFACAKKRAAGEPLAYILGTAEFMGMTFKVTPDTLIPRADTETLVETVCRRCAALTAARRTAAPVQVLDIGTGSGCVGISIAKLCENTEVTLLGISAGALETAAENARLNGAAVKTVQCDIMREFPEDAPSCKFDIIVSNPPYIRSGDIAALQTEVRDFEPRAALDGGADGLAFYRRICAAAPQMLKKGGMLAFEIGYDQAAEVVQLMRAFRGVEVIKDLTGNDRVVCGTVG